MSDDSDRIAALESLACDKALELSGKESELIVLRGRVAQHEKTIEEFQKVFVRISEAHGITTPLILLGYIKDNSDSYATALANFVEQTMKQAKKGTVGQ